VPDVVGQLHYHVLHDVEHEHLEEVALLEGLREDHLVGHVALLVALLLDHLLLARELLHALAAVEHDHDDLVVLDLPGELGEVLHLDHIGVRDLQPVEPA